jgi:hypothetical protein
MDAILSAALQPGAHEASVTELLAQVLKLLRDQSGRQGYTLDEIESLLGHPVRSNTALLLSLTRNPKLRFDELEGRISFPQSGVTDRRDLLRYIKTRGRATDDGSELAGFTATELADLYPDAPRDLVDLSRTGVELEHGSHVSHQHSVPVAAGGIRRVRNYDTLKPDVIFHRDDPRE